MPAENKTCARCGAALTPGAPAGWCAHCALKGVFAETGDKGATTLVLEDIPPPRANVSCLEDSGGSTGQGPFLPVDRTRADVE